MPLDAFDSVFSQFPAMDAGQWKAKIIADLQGGSFDALITSNADNIPVLPFYTKEDLLTYQLDIPLQKHHGWLIMERILVNDPKTANNQALDALQNGAMSILFDLQDELLEEAHILQLLKDIRLDIAPVYFEDFASEDREALENAAPGSCTERIAVPQLESKVNELTYAITQGMQTGSGKILIHFSTGNNFFLEIAKLRACRWLWKQTNDINNTAREIFILCETGIQHRSDEDENTNILRNTTEAMSAIIGGCDALLIHPHNNQENSSFGKRIARNVQHILFHECGFGELDDVGRGAYFIEYLTYSLSKKTWEKLQSV